MLVSNFSNCKSSLPWLPTTECVVVVDVPDSVILIAPAPMVLVADLVAIFVLLLVTGENSVSGV